MLTIDTKNAITTLLTKEFKIGTKEEKPKSAKGDSLEISSSMNAFKKIDSFLNLGDSDRLDTSDLTPEEKKEFFKMLTKLIDKGIVGYEEYEINGQKEKRYIVNQIGDQRLKDAELWDEDRYTPKSRYNSND